MRFLYTRPQLIALALCGAATLAHDCNDSPLESALIQVCVPFGELTWLPDEHLGQPIEREGHYQWDFLSLSGLSQFTEELWRPAGSFLKASFSESQIVALAIAAAAAMAWWNDDEELEQTLDLFRDVFEEYAVRLGFNCEVLSLGWHYPQINGAPLRGSGHHQWTQEQLQIIKKIPIAWLQGDFYDALLTHKLELLEVKEGEGVF